MILKKITTKTILLQRPETFTFTQIFGLDKTLHNFILSVTIRKIIDNFNPAPIYLEASDYNFKTSIIVSLGVTLINSLIILLLPFTQHFWVHLTKNLLSSQIKSEFKIKSKQKFPHV